MLWFGSVAHEEFFCKSLLHVNWFLTILIKLFDWITESHSQIMHLFETVKHICSFIHSSTVWDKSSSCDRFSPRESLYFAVNLEKLFENPVMIIHDRSTSLSRLCFCCSYFVLLCYFSLSLCLIVLIFNIIAFVRLNVNCFLLIYCLFYFLVSLKAVVTLIWKVPNVSQSASVSPSSHIPGSSGTFFAVLYVSTW